MGENNFLSAYKLINSQLVMSNQKLKEEIRDKIEMMNELNEEVFNYREENKTLRDMIQKLVEQFKTITTVMVSVRDQSESVFNLVNNKHRLKQAEQEARPPVAQLVYEKLRAERPPYVDEAAIEEQEDEDNSMRDYRSSSDVDDNDVDQQERNFTLPKSPYMKRLERRSKSRCFNESFETIDTRTVVDVARKSQEYLQTRDSRASTEGERTISETTVDDSNTIIAVDCTELKHTKDGHDNTSNTVQEANNNSPTLCNDISSSSSEANSTIDQSPRPLVSTSVKRFASDSLLHDAEHNKENTIGDDTIMNASCSTPMATAKQASKKRRHNHLQPPSVSFVALSPVVSLKPLTRANLIQHNVSIELLHSQRKARSTSVKQEQLDNCSDQSSIESGSTSRRPRRKAAPTTMKEQRINVKLRR